MSQTAGVDVQAVEDGATPSETLTNYLIMRNDVCDRATDVGDMASDICDMATDVARLGAE